MDALDRVGASHLCDRASFRLSGGEKRSVAIASVLAMSPDILVMDEPSSNLDPMARQRLIELLQTFKHTKIIATHDLDLAVDVCQRTIILHNGQITADGPTHEIFQNKKLLSDSSLAQPLRMQGCSVCSQ
jgi:cobalt/nickel transport system ATP-binding protein